MTKGIRYYTTIAKTIVRNAFGLKLEPEVGALKLFLLPGSICFDIGAAFGRYTLALSRLAGHSGHIYCFEPAEYSYAILAHILKFYRLKNASIAKMALLDTRGSKTLALPIKKHSNHHPIVGHSLAHLVTPSDSNYVAETVPATTIDHYMAEARIPRLDFIKCDVEGAELLVFKGGLSTLKRYKPTILCEVYQAWLKRFDATPEEVYQFFTQLGYQAFVIENGTLKEVRCLSEDRNYFFIDPKTSRTQTGRA